MGYFSIAHERFVVLPIGPTALTTAVETMPESPAIGLTLRQRLSRNARDAMVGRTADLRQLRHALTEGAPAVVHLHGLSGIGKSVLLAAFAEEARSAGATVLSLECGSIEPTERGALQEIGRMLGCMPHLATVAAALAVKPAPVLLVLDTYERFVLLDTWVRQNLVPSLPARALVLLASRLPPSAAWTEAPEWQGLFSSMLLGTLSDDEATALMDRLDVPHETAASIVRSAAGHPLTLTLAARAALSNPSANVQPLDMVMPKLAGRYLEQIGDANMREAFRAASVARRISIGLLRALRPEADPVPLYDHFASLPFVTPMPDGLEMHRAVRRAVAAELQSSDPDLHRHYRQRAWHYFSQQTEVTPRAELWRCTADLIYLIRNPVIREAFFPGEAARLAVEPARPADRSAIIAIAAEHDGPAGATVVESWLDAAPHAFFVVRASDCPVEGFYCVLDTTDPAVNRLQADPVTACFLQDIAHRPLDGGQTAVLLRRWLGRTEGESPSAVQAACWLDVKRHYMERRPQLRRVYMAVADFEPYAVAADSLGIVPLSEQVPLGNRVMRPALLDMGPGSVDGWLSRLAAEELHLVVQDGQLDAARRALRVNGQLVRLTRREFDVMAYLVARQGEVVPRDGLIQDVWNLRFDPGSNVVDAVVASLRRKLGVQAGAIETVRGFGYTYHAPTAPTKPP